MNAKEALQKIAGITISTRFGDWGMESTCVKDLSSTKEPLSIISAALLRLESAEKERDEAKKELAEIKGRAKEIRTYYADRQFGIGYVNVARHIDSILKGEGK